MNTLKNIIRRMPLHIVCYGIRPAQLKREKEMGFGQLRREERKTP